MVGAAQLDSRIINHNTGSISYFIFTPLYCDDTFLLATSHESEQDWPAEASGHRVKSWDYGAI